MSYASDAYIDSLERDVKRLKAENEGLRDENTSLRKVITHMIHGNCSTCEYGKTNTCDFVGMTCRLMRERAERLQEI